MINHRICRFIHIGQPLWYSVNKSQLGKLRKKTGFTFANCRKALELHGNNMEEAEKWLNEQAQALGWAKATKLEGRPTAQGLIGVSLKKNQASIVEVNCETDFVARNKNFRTMVECVTGSCLKYISTINTDSSIVKLGLESEKLKTLPGEEGKSLADQVALLIGNVGENITLRRACCVKVNEDLTLAGYTHPTPSTNSASLLGKYGALVVFKTLAQGTDIPNRNPLTLPVEHIGRVLCQHIIGMNPTKIGVEGVDLPAENPDEEKCMIHQEYLLDPSQKVSSFLADVGVSVIDFVRFECGEELDVHTNERNLDDVAVEQGG